MNVVFVAAECAPYAKVGGLADVAGSLPQALTRLGHRVVVIIPGHGVIRTDMHGIAPHSTFDMSWNGEVSRVEVLTAQSGGVPVYFLRSWPFFTGHEDFIYHQDEGVNVGRYLFFSAAALAFSRRLAQQESWRPDVFHLHDWHTGPVALLLARLYRGDSVLGEAASVLSIHNMRYQGWGIGWHIARAGLPMVDNQLLLATGLADNSLAIGLVYSTMLSTVSARYAQEITTYEGGFGLDGLVHARQMRLVGIVNGIDTVRWNPAASTAITAPYDAETLNRKVDNKLALQKKLGLPARPEVPLASAVTRLVDQKGPDIMAAGVRHMLHYADMQFVVLGTGDPHWEAEMRRLATDYPEKASAQIMFDENLSEEIYAGSDIFLMPSLFEPCGIGQMLAMRYGTLPVVRAVGGLVDTVDPAIGFLFTDYSANGVIAGLSAALDVFYRNPAGWLERQRRAMALDFSWDASARRYVQLYERAVAVHRSYPSGIAGG